MRIYIDCIPCFLRQSIEAARRVTPDPCIHEQVVRGVLGLINNMDTRQTPPAIAQHIHRLIRDLTGIEDPYLGVKKQFNAIAMQLYPKLRKTILDSADPLDTAVRLAIAGNIIDFGVMGKLVEGDLHRTISDCLTADFSDIQLEPFREAVQNARDILYLADNAGEIVFDRLLIEQLPREKITVAVKGLPIINDATMDDAVSVGLTELVEVIDNGTDVPGTVLDCCSVSFRKRFEQADLIIAKGQGNYETLSDVAKNIFFILKAKCQVVAHHLGCEVGKMVFQRSKTICGERENVEI
ncbi:MAG: DUF89 family protein [Sedimentisphaerales bacterium]|nr:DUF89 family protein [Sedimentisphaerales bacterium]